MAKKHDARSSKQTGARRDIRAAKDGGFPIKAARKPARKGAHTRSSRDAREQMHAQLTRSRAVLMTAILATERRGVFDEVSRALRGVLFAIDRVLPALEVV